MSEMKNITIGGQTYTVRDPNAVAFDATQSLTDSQKAQARENIGANALVVTVADGVASHTPAQIYANTQKGCTAVLLYEGMYFNMTRATEYDAVFSTATDENFLDCVFVSESGSVERYEHGFVALEYFNELLGGVPSFLSVKFTSEDSADEIFSCSHTFDYIRNRLEAGSIVQGRFFTDAQENQFTATAYLVGADRAVAVPGTDVCFYNPVHGTYWCMDSTNEQWSLNN